MITESELRNKVQALKEYTEILSEKEKEKVSKEDEHDICPECHEDPCECGDEKEVKESITGVGYTQDETLARIVSLTNYTTK